MYFTQRTKLARRSSRQLRLNAGFSLLEVVVSLLVASLALLGLAATQLRSLQFANNSFDYTVSLVKGQNAIERMWPQLCNLQHANPALFQDAAFRQRLMPSEPLQFKYTLTLPEVYANEMQVTVNWVDQRVSAEQQILNQITLNANFVEMPSGCTP